MTTADKIVACIVEYKDHYSGTQDVQNLFSLQDTLSSLLVNYAVTVASLGKYYNEAVIERKIFERSRKKELVTSKDQMAKNKIDLIVEGESTELLKKELEAESLASGSKIILKAGMETLASIRQYISYLKEERMKT